MAELTYRKAVPGDLAQLTSLAMKYAKACYPKVRASATQIQAGVRHAIASPSDYVEVAVQDGRIVAAIGVLCHEGLWMERKLANIVFWVSEVAGAGRRLMRHFLSWVSQRRAIRLIGLSPMSDELTQTYAKVLRNFKFESAGGSLIRYN
jgi:hypothetical protein